MLYCCQHIAGSVFLGPSLTGPSVLRAWKMLQRQKIASRTFEKLVRFRCLSLSSLGGWAHCKYLETITHL